MGLETATYVASLVVSNPDGTDQRSTADDHLRLIKAALKRTFPLLDGAVSLSHTQVMYLNDLSASVQVQLNQLRDGTATANAAINARYANSASLALYANSASYAAFAGQSSSASYATTAGQASSASFATIAATATNATNAAQAANATSASYAGNAGALSGFLPDANPNVNTVAVRNGSGYLAAAYFNQSSAETENPNIGSFVVSNQSADKYFRFATLAYTQTFLTTRNVSGKTGIAKTLSSTAPSGGSDGDIWYRY